MEWNGFESIWHNKDKYCFLNFCFNYEFMRVVTGLRCFIFLIVNGGQKKLESPCIGWNDKMIKLIILSQISNFPSTFKEQSFRSPLIYEPFFSISYILIWTVNKYF